MTNEALEAQNESRISRRNALKAAAAVGVGAVAWTGPKITSFGATPAYAASCTFAELFSLSGGDRNSDQSSGCTHWRYHEIKVPAAFRSRFTLTPEIPEDPGVCSNDIQSGVYSGGFTLCYPVGDHLDCYVRVLLYNQNGQGGAPSLPKGVVYDHTFPDGGETTVGDRECIVFELPKGDDVAAFYNQSMRYSVSVSCVTDGDEACFPGQIP